MAKRTIFLPIDAERFGTLRVADIARSMKDGVQSTSREGVPQWVVRCWRVPPVGRSRETEITVPSAEEPAIKPDSLVTVDGLTAIVWEHDDGKHGLFYVADGVSTVRQ